MSDHQHIEASLARLARRVTETGLEGLSEPERVALLAYSAHGLIARGGFKQFYLTEFRLTALVAALRELKLSALANAAESTAAQFPEASLAEDPLARREHVAALVTDRQDYSFFRHSPEEMLGSIAKYWKRVKA